MQVGEAMTVRAETIGPGDALRDAARKMRDIAIGALPVCDGDRLVGMLTDRDIVVRSIAAGVAPDDVATIIFKSDYRQTPVDYATKAWYLSDIWKSSPIELSLSLSWTVSFVISVIITVALWFFLTKTDLGKSIRATAQDRDAAWAEGEGGEPRVRNPRTPDPWLARGPCA